MKRQSRKNNFRKNNKGFDDLFVDSSDTPLVSNFLK